jgi:hypothetical protein
MNNDEKLAKLLSAIDDIETFDDGSIRIMWKANVSHDVPGHLITFAAGLNVITGKQVHFNPELSQAINQIAFADIQKECDDGVRKAVEESQRRMSIDSHCHSS